MAVIRQHALIIVPFLIAYSAGVWYLVSGLAPASLNTTLQAIVIPLMLTSRVRHIGLLFIVYNSYIYIIIYTYKSNLMCNTVVFDCNTVNIHR